MKIITDNEWEGKYELLEEQFEEDGIDTIISLGDNLPTGERENQGSNSYFKTQLKQLAKRDPAVKELPLDRQLETIYNQNQNRFLELYGGCIGYIQRGVEFLRTSSLPQIIAITGNRELDYQLLLDFIAEKVGVPNTDYMEELISCGKFDLHTKPKVLMYDSTSVFLLPYNSKDAVFDLEENVEKLRSLNGERIVVMTHENPCPEKIGVDRKAKMQDTLDNYVCEVRKISPDVLLFCGHLDKSAEPLAYEGIKIQPLSGSEVVIYNTETGKYNKNQLITGCSS